MKNDEKWDEKRNNLSFLLSCVAFLSSAAWKNVGMTVTCNRCDARNIMWIKILCDFKKQKQNNNNNKQQQQQQQRKQQTRVLVVV